MAMIERSALEEMITALSLSVRLSRIDVSTIYRIQAYLTQVESPATDRVNKLVDLYDMAAYEDNIARAVSAANRMIGILQGIHLATEEETRRTIGFDDETDTPFFHLEKDDRLTVLKLASEMRAYIVSSSIFDHAHKVRLLRRISAIEKEIHKPKGMLDVILGGLTDTGEALGKFGTDVKPIVDRMTEIAKIARSKSEEYESLPAPEEIKRLPPPDEDVS